MKKMKKLLGIVLAGAMAVSMTACSGGASSDSLPKNIELQVPAKAGGGTDVTARALATQVSKDSGMTEVLSCSSTPPC